MKDINECAKKRKSMFGNNFYSYINIILLPDQSVKYQRNRDGGKFHGFSVATAHLSPHRQHRGQEKNDKQTIPKRGTKSLI